MLPADSVLPLLLLMALLMALSLHGLAASGQFPHEHRSPALRVGLGPAILFGSIGVAIVYLAVGMTFTWRLIPWPAAIIGGGAMVLAAPLVLRRLPDSFVDGRGALVVFAGAGAVLALVMIGVLLGGRA